MPQPSQLRHDPAAKKRVRWVLHVCMCVQDAYTTATRHELVHTNIRVTSIQPGGQGQQPGPFDLGCGLQFGFCTFCNQWAPAHPCCSAAMAMSRCAMLC